MMTPDEISAWFNDHPEITHFDVGVVDLNGVIRGKRLPASMAAKAATGGIRMPLSSIGVDIWGRDSMASGQVLETGDRDGACPPTQRGVVPVDWLEKPTAFLPLWMSRDDGKLYEADPRAALARVANQYTDRGLSAVCAVELEFYLVDHERNETGLAQPAVIGRRLDANAVYSVDDLHRADAFLNDLYASCRAMNVPADAAISENGCGQFEVNLVHSADVLKAADDAQLFKFITKGVARKHGFAATFMSKPYGEESGSGLHVHVSVVNSDGANIFDDGSEKGADAMRHAIGGLLQALPEQMLIFAPHANSYRRLRPGTHAPINLAWGYENRTAAIRVPSGDNNARRVEHRVAGADANPYLVLASILGAMIRGMDSKSSAPTPVVGNAYATAGESLPTTWRDAIERFERSHLAADLFGELLKRMYVAAKWQEFERFAGKVSRFELDSYLETV